MYRHFLSLLGSALLVGPLFAQTTFSVYLNSNFETAEAIDPKLGYDLAVGAPSKIMIDGTDCGDSLVTDGDDLSSFESPWTNGHREAVLTIDLQSTCTIQAMRWIASDANWIWNADVDFSLDGAYYQPISSLQEFDMHKRWSVNDFPLAIPLQARWLRFRLYNPNGTMNIVRLPKSIQIFDGAENDSIRLPAFGPLLQQGIIATDVDSDSINKELRLESLGSGSYIATWKTFNEPSTKLHWKHVWVPPRDQVDKDKTRRFGINSSDPKLAKSMSDCGFGWVRFENAKWIMSSTGPDDYAFDGSIGPWHVNQDAIYESYHQLDMKVLPYIFQTPEWATKADANITKNRAGYPPKKAQDYGDAVYQFTARYGDHKVDPSTLKTTDRQTGLNRVSAIELWNEPNLVGPDWAAFVGPIEEYFEVMRKGVEGVKRADPQMTITSCGWAGIDLATIKQMIDHRFDDGKSPLDLVDVINVHFYSGIQEPEVAIEDPNTRQESRGDLKTYLDQLSELIQWRDTHKPNAEIWLTETGNDVGGPIGLTERKQAAKLPRVTMITLAKGIDKVFIYRESGSQPSMHAGAGLVRDDGSMRPSWLTMATLMRQLQGMEGKAVRIPHPDPNVWLLEWRAADRAVVAAWHVPLGIDVSKVVKIKLESLQKHMPIECVDAFGHRLEIDSIEQELELSEFPIYVTYP